MTQRAGETTLVDKVFFAVSGLALDFDGGGLAPLAPRH